MNIEIHTLAFVIVITHLIQIIVFTYQYLINKNYRGIEWWLMWSVAEVIGFVFLLLREITSIHVMAIILQNSFFIIGVIFLYIGVMRFFEKKENRIIIFIIFFLFITSFLFFLFVNDDIDVRGIIICVTLAIISFLSAHALLFYRPKSVVSSANFTAVVFFVHGCFFLFRTIMLIIGINSDIFLSTVLNIATYIDALVCSILWTFVFVVMINQRLNSDMKEAKEEMELVFNTSPDSAVISRLNDGSILYANEGFSVLSGYSHDEAVGKSSLEINIWENPEDRERFVTELREEGFVENFESIIKRKDNSQMSGLISAKIINIQDVPHIISVTRDITNRKLAEEALRKSEEKFRLLVENSHDIIYSLTADGVFIFVSPAWTMLLGHSVTEVAGKSFQPFVHPDDLPRCLEFLKSVIETGQRQEGVEYRVQHINGTWYWHTSSAVPIRDKAGRIIGFYGIARDITERKLEEEALRNEKWRLASIIEGTHVGTWEWNVQTGDTVFNEIWAQIIGYTLDELAPVSIKTWEKFAHPDDLKKSGELLERHFAGELPYYDYECRMKHKDGRWVEVHDRGKVVTWTADGKPLMMFGTHMDITERRKKEEELKELISKLQKALEEIKTLRGIVPICANCKKIRDDKGYWEQVENYVSKHSEAIFSHSICPDCMKSLYPEYSVYKDAEPDK